MITKCVFVIVRLISAVLECFWNEGRLRGGCTVNVQTLINSMLFSYEVSTSLRFN